MSSIIAITLCLAMTMCYGLILAFRPENSLIERAIFFFFVFDLVHVLSNHLARSRLTPASQDDAQEPAPAPAPVPTPNAPAASIAETPAPIPAITITAETAAASPAVTITAVPPTTSTPALPGMIDETVVSTTVAAATPITPPNTTSTPTAEALVVNLDDKRATKIVVTEEIVERFITRTTTTFFVDGTAATSSTSTTTSSTTALAAAATAAASTAATVPANNATPATPAYGVVNTTSTSTSTITPSPSTASTDDASDAVEPTSGQAIRRQQLEQAERDEDDRERKAKERSAKSLLLTQPQEAPLRPLPSSSAPTAAAAPTTAPISSALPVVAVASDTPAPTQPDALEQAPTIPAPDTDQLATPWANMLLVLKYQLAVQSGQAIDSDAMWTHCVRWLPLLRWCEVAAEAEAKRLTSAQGDGCTDAELPGPFWECPVTAADAGLIWVRYDAPKRPLVWTDEPRKPLAACEMPFAPFILSRAFFGFFEPPVETASAATIPSSLLPSFGGCVMPRPDDAWRETFYGGSSPFHQIVLPPTIWVTAPTPPAIGEDPEPRPMRALRRSKRAAQELERGREAPRAPSQWLTVPSARKRSTSPPSPSSPSPLLPASATAPSVEPEGSSLAAEDIAELAQPAPAAAGDNAELAQPPPAPIPATASPPAAPPADTTGPPASASAPASPAPATPGLSPTARQFTGWQDIAAFSAGVLKSRLAEDSRWCRTVEYLSLRALLTWARVWAEMQKSSSRRPPPHPTLLPALTDRWQRMDKAQRPHVHFALPPGWVPEDLRGKRPTTNTVRPSPVFRCPAPPQFLTGDFFVGETKKFFVAGHPASTGQQGWKPAVDGVSWMPSDREALAPSGFLGASPEAPPFFRGFVVDGEAEEWWMVGRPGPPEARKVE